MAYARKDIDWMEARQPYSGPRDQDHKRGYRERFHSPDRRGIRHHDRASVEKLRQPSATGRRSSSVHSRHSRSRSQTSTHYASLQIAFQIKQSTPSNKGVAQHISRAEHQPSASRRRTRRCYQGNDTTGTIWFSAKTSSFTFQINVRTVAYRIGYRCVGK